MLEGIEAIRLADAGPHPNRAHAAWGRRAHRLEPGPATAPVVAWTFTQRLAGHSAARITWALNDAAVPCPSAADPKRNPHRSGARWTLRTVAAILANPRYTGRQVWNRQRTDFDLVDPANTALGHRQVQRWNQILPPLAALAILLNGHASGQAAGSGTMQITTPGGTACLIDRLRTVGIILIYDPRPRAIRTDDSHPIAVTAAAGR